ncbi:MAG: 2-oxoacid:acceptor oxidoreductase subunit alpha [Planctomycetes bacterium]|jgi:2-oxoglutarate ferredoxin oxidoreductase subunit alpha|nr:2-oxoacid:acceptor oxidoreductase subunit alpha [Planctomycetota bacterium]
MEFGERARTYLGGLAGQVRFSLGDEAAAFGALFAGCRFFGGYPITPASEVAETMARELPRVDGYYVQFEDEIGSIAGVVGAARAGARAMTATSGPGYSLMQENIGYAVMTETPCVVVDVQRSGPSTGQATKPAQGDVLQARWGTHGDHEAIALAPNSVQECFDLMIECFNFAERYRHPVTFLMDGEIGHLREKLVFPALDRVRLFPRGGFDPADEEGLITPYRDFGHGEALHVTGSTHKENGMRDVVTPEVHERLITRCCAKIDRNRRNLYRTEERFLEDAEVLVLCYGAASRPALGAVVRARRQGRKVGFLRLKTIWPFCGDTIAGIGARVRRILVPEMNLGQISREVERFVRIPVERVSRIGGVPHTVDEILRAITREAP